MTVGRKLLVEGWRGINHSYAMVNQWQILELLRRGQALRFIDLPFFRPEWNDRSNSGGFDAPQAAAIAALRAPDPAEAIDVTFRIAYPYDFSAARTDRLHVFGTSEDGSIEGMVRDGLGVAQARRNGVRIVTPSAWSKHGFLAYGFTEQEVAVVPHGVDPAIFHPASPAERERLRGMLRFEPDAVVLLSLGSMSRNKGVDLLLRAYAILKPRHPRLRLALKDSSDLYGWQGQGILRGLMAGPHAGDFTEPVLRGLSFISRNLTVRQMQALYVAADCYVSPYRCEGFNMPPLEAAACGTPIVVTRGGATDAYFDPRLGHAIESRIVEDGPRRTLEPDLDSLIDAIERVMARPQATGGPDGSRLVHDRFSWQAVCDTLQGVLFDKD
ncbi:glycosyltransferase family 4 protein [Roseomonas sp. CAU 1739]|uniref:glycosyltransferase family 4 protein n=1 Tax=Roseomonas sp. CAU 1739 TaxID=3140364 RepID=UPI00325B0B70